MLPKMLFALSRWVTFGRLVRFGFHYASFLIPVKKILNNADVISFFHPKQFYNHHILIIPKQPIRTPLHLAEDKNVGYAVSILSAAGEIVRQYKRLQGKSVLCMNGGPRQDVPQIHFHLFVGEGYVNELGELNPGQLVISGKAVKIFQHPNPNWDVHILMIPNENILMVEKFSTEQELAITEGVKFLPKLDSTFKLAEKGYTVYIQEERAAEVPKILFHITAGKRLCKSPGVRSF